MDKIISAFLGMRHRFGSCYLSLVSAVDCYALFDMDCAIRYNAPLETHLSSGK